MLDKAQKLLYRKSELMSKKILRKQKHYFLSTEVFFTQIITHLNF